MRVLFTDLAWKDHVYWQAADADIAARINELIKDLRRPPFRGLDKPEPLRGALQGWCSRPIADEHRLVYRVTGAAASQSLEIVQRRYDY